ncbi:HNH endonuclease [Pseudoclavibacter sp. RFBG4]|uniref:HNH endonuclease n=1 Tax=Pseudoclavibacter sp. RFBG4 TaxID=2080575 RepID=UPI000CE7316F|nr:HNH endonuclease [Pseudoclavibacter sp. RFBG4]
MAAGIPGRTTAAHRKNRAHLKKLTAEHGLACALCGIGPIDTTLDWRHRDAFAYDHKLSIKTHPELADDPTNGQPAHRLCNANKGAGDQRPGLGDPSEVW